MTRRFYGHRPSPHPPSLPSPRPIFRTFKIIFAGKMDVLSIKEQLQKERGDAAMSRMYGKLFAFSRVSERF